MSGLREALEVPLDLLRGGYPPFVTGGVLPAGHVPVFVFHTLEREAFGRDLRHLRDNGYRTLSAAEYLQHLAGAAAAPERAVLLTLDDGRSSVASVGRPLLEEFGMKAVVFLIPGRMSERTSAPEPVGEGLLSWPEVESLAKTGIFDFESHSLSHARIHTAPRVVDFVAPGRRSGYAALDLPLIHEAGRDLPAGEVPLGTPVLAWESRLSASPRFFEDEGLRAVSVARVAAAGGERFFEAPGWRSALFETVAGRPIEGRCETPAEREDAIARELSDSKRLIEEHTGRPVTLFCYPWHVSSPAAERLVREAGYRAAFVGKDPRTPITRAGDDPLRIARLGEDWLPTLPGDGRVGAFEVLRRKWRRRRVKP